MKGWRMTNAGERRSGASVENPPPQEHDEGEEEAEGEDDEAEEFVDAVPRLGVGSLEAEDLGGLGGVDGVGGIGGRRRGEGETGRR